MAGEEGSGAEDASSMNAHRLVQYFFLDVASALESQQGANNAGPTWADVNSVDHLRCGSKWSELISESLIKFPSAFGVPPSVIKLTQAFWLLDHREFEDAMAMLLDPLVVPADITLAQHRSILMAFLAQGQPHLALKYTQIRKPPQKDPFDIQLHSSVLLANGKVHEAFQYQRQNKVLNLQSSSVLSSFYSKAERLGKLDSILQVCGQ